jgi:putative ABC transport system substrate-binding protein
MHEAAAGAYVTAMPMFTRRRLILAFGASGVVCNAPRLGAQAKAAIVRIGFLSPTRRPPTEAAFWKELERLGYAEGRNVVVEYRSADGDFARLGELAADLVDRKVDVIVAYVTEASLAARRRRLRVPS